jgi:hypothetical protein
MEWNSIRMAEKFLQRANGIHPEEADGEEHHDRELARQNVLYECYMTSFNRETLIEFLYSSIANNFTVPKEVKDERIYRDAYIRQAREVLKEVERSDGQKPA